MKYLETWKAAKSAIRNACNDGRAFTETELKAVEAWKAAKKILTASERHEIRLAAR